MNEQSFDAVIVGAGIVGTMAAHALMRGGARVALVERHRVGAGTTARSFTWINASSKVADEPYHRLSAMGAARYRELAKTHGDERLGLHRTGMLLYINTDDASNHEAVRQQAGYLRDYGYPNRMIDRDELAALEPHVSFSTGDVALYAMTEDWLDAPRFTRAMADEIQNSSSVVMENCRARELAMTDAGAITGVITSQGTLNTDKALLAAGPDTPEALAALTGYSAYAARFPMRRVPGLLVTTPASAQSETLKHIIYFESASGAFHIRPAGDGALRLGANDIDGLISEEASRDKLHFAATRLLERAQERLPCVINGITADQCSLDVGVRPYPSDGKPLAGALPGANGLYLIATHSGITLAPALGDLMARLMLRHTSPPELVPFSLERFPGFTL